MHAPHTTIDPPIARTPRVPRPCLGAVALAAIVALGAAQGAVAAKVTTGKPSVTTSGAGRLRGTSTALSGAVNPHGEATTYYFQFGPSASYGKTTTTASLPAGNARVRVSQTASPLAAGYHYRLVATNASGTTLGRDRTVGAKKHTKLGFRVAKPTAPVHYGGSYVIAGTMTGATGAAHALSLQQSPFPFLEAFVDLGAPAQADAAGRFSFRLTHLTKTTQYRIATIEPRPVYSRILTLSVAPRVTLEVRQSPVRGLVRLYGTITPAKVGARVNIQLFKAVRPGDSEKASERTGKFVTRYTTRSKRATSRASRFSVVAKLTRGGAYRAFVQLPPKGPLTSGGSATVLLHGARTR